MKTTLLGLLSLVCMQLNALPLPITSYEHSILQNLSSFLRIPEQFTEWLGVQTGDKEASNKVAVYQKYEGYQPLFSRYKGLSQALSYVQLGDLPTPIIHCKGLSDKFKGSCVYLKHDGVTGKTQDGIRSFGGNKLRKLEYLLADALAHGHNSVMTFGGAGSNHALQTAVGARSLGLRAISVLLPQPNSFIVRRNLLMQQDAHADVYYSGDRDVLGLLAPVICYDYKQRYGSVPYVIPVGGSCPLGVIGYVQAACELKDQIDAGLLPPPDRLYVTLGSGGTAAGLLLGLKAVGIKTKISFVLDEPEAEPGKMMQKVHRLFTETNDLLHVLDSTFRKYELEQSDYEVYSDQSGEGYGLFTQEVGDAIRCIYEQEHIVLDGTYTGKCAATFLNHLAAGQGKGQTVLFWDTFCGESFESKCCSVNYKDLPQALHYYFETDVQSLDVVA